MVQLMEMVLWWSFCFGLFKGWDHPGHANETELKTDDEGKAAGARERGGGCVRVWGRAVRDTCGPEVWL